jgi:hypothetical protein
MLVSVEPLEFLQKLRGEADLHAQRHSKFLLGQSLNFPGRDLLAASRQFLHMVVLVLLNEHAEHFHH